MLCANTLAPLKLSDSDCSDTLDSPQSEQIVCPRRGQYPLDASAGLKKLIKGDTCPRLRREQALKPIHADAAGWPEHWSPVSGPQTLELTWPPKYSACASDLGILKAQEIHCPTFLFPILQSTAIETSDTNSKKLEEDSQVATHCTS